MNGRRWYFHCSNVDFPLPEVGDRLVVTKRVDSHIGNYTAAIVSLEPAQPGCGHPVSAIRYDDDLGGGVGTNWCEMCAKESRE